MDRREFIGRAGALVIAATLPAAGSAAALANTASHAADQRLTDWTIDDMWAVYPRPAQAIGFGRSRARLVAVAAVDAQFG